MVGGYDFAKVIDAFWRGHEQDNETLKSNAIRWLRGEYTTQKGSDAQWNENSR
ncbi:probable ATP /GTP binding protein [Klebsiella pneumoniae]|nr:probable ATP /GTP binding protein [Klebsiella pneumoniae]